MLEQPSAFGAFAAPGEGSYPSDDAPLGDTIGKKLRSYWYSLVDKLVSSIGGSNADDFVPGHRSSRGTTALSPPRGGTTFDGYRSADLGRENEFFYCNESRCWKKRGETDAQRAVRHQEALLKAGYGCAGGMHTNLNAFGAGETVAVPAPPPDRRSPEEKERVRLERAERAQQLQQCQGAGGGGTKVVDSCWSYTDWTTGLEVHLGPGGSGVPKTLSELNRERGINSGANYVHDKPAELQADALSASSSSSASGSTTAGEPATAGNGNGNAYGYAHLNPQAQHQQQYGYAGGPPYAQSVEGGPAPRPTGGSAAQQASVSAFAQLQYQPAAQARYASPWSGGAAPGVGHPSVVPDAVTSLSTPVARGGYQVPHRQQGRNTANYGNSRRPQPGQIVATSDPFG